jgi:hypothetical protein
MTTIDAAVPRWRAAVEGMRWAHSTRDGLAHVFPDGDSRQGRWLRAVCSSPVPAAALDPATVVGPRCVLAVAAAGTARHRDGDRPTACARLLAWWRRYHHDQQPPPLAQMPDIRLPLTTMESAQRAGWTLGTVGSGAAAPCVLVPSSPVYYHSVVAW